MDKAITNPATARIVAYEYYHKITGNTKQYMKVKKYVDAAGNTVREGIKITLDFSGDVTVSAIERVTMDMAPDLLIWTINSIID